MRDFFRSFLPKAKYENQPQVLQRIVQCACANLSKGPFWGILQRKIHGNFSLFCHC